jgi:putative peptidoglycan lipid II flippase
MKDLLFRVTSHLIISIIPVSLFCAWYSREIVVLIYLRGVFDEIAVRSTASAFSNFSVSLLVSALLPVCLRGCYATKNVRAAVYGTAAGAFTLAGLGLLLGPKLGVAGVALAASIASVPSLLWMGYSLRKWCGGINLLGLLRVGFLSLCCAFIALMGISALLSVMNARLLVVGALFVFLYTALSYLLNRRELMEVWRSMVYS